MIGPLILVEVDARVIPATVELLDRNITSQTLARVELVADQSTTMMTAVQPQL